MFRVVTVQVPCREVNNDRRKEKNVLGKTFCGLCSESYIFGSSGCSSDGS